MQLRQICLIQNRWWCRTNLIIVEWIPVCSDTGGVFLIEFAAFQVLLMLLMDNANLDTHGESVIKKVYTIFNKLSDIWLDTCNISALPYNKYTYKYLHCDKISISLLQSAQKDYIDRSNTSHMNYQYLLKY